MINYSDPDHLFGNGVLDRYLAGEASVEERAQVEQHLASDPELRRVVDGLREVSFAEGLPAFVGDVDEDWRRLAARTKGHGGISGRTYDEAGLRRVNISWRYLAIAAALIVGFFGIKQLPELIHTSKPTPDSKTYSTAPGQRASVTLADGSQVTLAPATTMRVTGRNVDLQGEAVFTVIQHTSVPFTVQTGNTLTRVLGTTFGVRAYGDQIRVAVSDGRVAIVGGPIVRSPSMDAHILSVGDVATITNDGQTTVTHNSNVIQMLAWTSGRLTFTEAPLSEVIPELERWYGVEIHAVPALMPRRVTAVFDNQPASSVITALASVVHARVAQQGSLVRLEAE